MVWHIFAHLHDDIVAPCQSRRRSAGNSKILRVAQQRVHPPLRASPTGAIENADFSIGGEKNGARRDSWPGEMSKVRRRLRSAKLLVPMGLRLKQQVCGARGAA